MIPVCIVAYKNPEALARCVASLPADTRRWIHDNSNDNIGLTKAANLLFLKALKDHWELNNDEPQYAVWLNQDVTLKPDTIDNAVAFMDAHPKCAIGGMKQLLTDNPDLIYHGGTGKAWPNGHHQTGRVSMGDCAESRPFGWVNCAAAIFRLSALDKIGLLDEGYFLCCQDSDICFRAWAAGYEVWYIADAVVLHDRGGVSSSPSPEQVEIISRDMLHFSHKWLPVLGGLVGGDLAARLSE